MNPPSSPTVYQMRIVINGISPMVWRRMLIPSEFNLCQLHRILQMSFGWGNIHLHAFQIHGKHYGSDARCTSSARLADFNLHSGECFLYRYNFYDRWEISLRLENTLSREPTRQYPYCLAGKGASPPEDCGGAWKYLRMLEERPLPPYPTAAVEILVRAAKHRLNHPGGPPFEDMEALEEALEEVSNHRIINPDRIHRRKLNAELQACNHGGEE